MLEADTLFKILLSALLGGIIGLEREWAHKGAGLRTNILIAVGSTLLTLMSLLIAETGKTADPGRIVAQIVTGVGFLGAGTIIQARLAVHGLTTAATIWTVAAIGITVGLGQHLLAFLISILVVATLSMFHLINRFIDKGRKGFAYTIRTVEHAGVLGEIKKILHELAISYEGARISKGKDGYEIDILLHSSDEKNRDFINQVMQLQHVAEISNEGI